MKSPTKTLFAYGAAAVALVLLVLIAVQQDALEQRLIQQTKAVAGLKDKTEQMGAQLERLAREGVAVSDGKAGGGEYVDPQAKLLHPEVENLLGKKDMRWPQQGVPMDGVLKRGWASGDPKTLNELVANAAEVNELISHYVGASAAARNNFTDPNTWYGDLAWRVEVTDDYKEFTIYLRRGLKWHPPAGVDTSNPKYAWLRGEHPLTAHDFVFTLDLTLNPQVENGATKNYYTDLESWKALDNYTLVVRWKKRVFHSVDYTLYWLRPVPEFLFAYNEDGSKIPKETLGLRFNNHWYNLKGYVGAGPYRMVSYEPGSKIVLERYDGYQGDRPPIKQIVYPIYTDTNQTVLKMKSGELSIGTLLPSQYRREILDYQDMPKDKRPRDNPFLNGEIVCKVVDLPSFRYIGWNSERPMFSDARVRKAMNYALNREAIIKDVFVGLGKIARGPFQEGSADLDPEIQPLPFDLDKAAALLDEAGWKDSDGDGLRDKELEGKRTQMEFRLLIYAGSTEYTALANIFKEDLLKIGVKANIESAEWSLMQKRMDEKDFDAFTGGWALDWMSDPYQLWHSSQADSALGSNRTSFRNAEADGLMEKLRETIDPAERTPMLHRLHRLIFDSFNYTFLSTDSRPICTNRNVKGLQFSKVRPIADTLPWWVESN